MDFTYSLELFGEKKALSYKYILPWKVNNHSA